MSDDPNMPKWALDPLLTESSPLQGAGGGGGGQGHGAVSSGGGGGADEGESDGDYDTDFSDEDMGQVTGGK